MLGVSICCKNFPWIFSFNVKLKYDFSSNLAFAFIHVKGFKYTFFSLKKFKTRF